MVSSVQCLSLFLKNNLGMGIGGVIAPTEMPSSAALSAFDGAGGQAAHELFEAEHENQEQEEHISST